jgi:hypothetical protein
LDISAVEPLVASVEGGEGRLKILCGEKLADRLADCGPSRSLPLVALLEVSLRALTLLLDDPLEDSIVSPIGGVALLLDDPLENSIVSPIGGVVFTSFGPESSEVRPPESDVEEIWGAGGVLEAETESFFVREWPDLSKPPHVTFKVPDMLSCLIRSMITLTSMK